MLPGRRGARPGSATTCRPTPRWRSRTRRSSSPATHEAATLAALGGRPRVDCGLLLTGAAGRLPARDALDRGHARSAPPARAGSRRVARRGVPGAAPGARSSTAGRLQEILRDLEHEVPVVADAARGRSRSPSWSAAPTSASSAPALGLVCLTETELFGAPPDHAAPADVPARARRSPRSRTSCRATWWSTGSTASAGTRGWSTLAVDGQPARLPPARVRGGGDRLYLPVQRMAAVTKYVGSGEEAPRLDKLGGTTWQRTKESVRASLREMAQELLRLYAERQVVEGLAIGGDTPWQHEFEAAFAFEETPDQLEAIRQVKADLERRQPMDRLVCGDVGYGKTEVAMRAALKVALDGHQVAVLVPTTILAEQHWNTFRERFAPYPVRVEMLSRFRSPTQQKAVLAGLAAGTVDVVIGTHRLLSKDVVFKDLGLLVVDEEHRFGVTHKERLKQLRKAVHVLTLTATPIPRTLSMAMSGIRDLSVIESPPADRLAIETVVCRFDPHVIKEAIERELGRGGQVFVVHNRIQSLPSLVRLIERLVPRARIAMAHGQMRGVASSRRTMLEYVEGAYDVLVTTAIIESGLDIPASNTIIINRADRLGLAQLYQLRGRVGRDRLQAYAYLLIPADGRVDETRGQAPPGDPGAHRPRLGPQGRAARHGDPGRRQPPGRPAARSDRDGRLRSLPEAPRGGGARAPRRAGRGRGRPGGHRGRGRLPARGLRGRGGAAPRALQAAGRAAAGGGGRRRAPGAPGPIRAAARRRGPAARRGDAPGPRQGAPARAARGAGGPRAPHVRAEHAGVPPAPRRAAPDRTAGGSARCGSSSSRRRFRGSRGRTTFQTLIRLLGEFRGPTEARR